MAEDTPRTVDAAFAAARRHDESALPPVTLTATFMLTISVERNKWTVNNTPGGPAVAEDFWHYLGDGTSMAEYLGDGMLTLRETGGVVRIEPGPRVIARGGDAPELPAEPPRGTEFWRGGQLIWSRGDDGWHCARGPCRNCPCDWFEVWDIGGVRGGDVTERRP